MTCEPFCGSESGIDVSEVCPGIEYVGRTHRGSFIYRCPLTGSTAIIEVDAPFLTSEDWV